MSESEIYYEILADFIQEKTDCEVEETYILSVLHELIRCGI